MNQLKKIKLKRQISEPQDPVPHVPVPKNSFVARTVVKINGNHPYFKFKEGEQEKIREESTRHFIKHSHMFIKDFTQKKYDTLLIRSQKKYVDMAKRTQWQLLGMDRQLAEIPVPELTFWTIYITAVTTIIRTTNKTDDRATKTEGATDISPTCDPPTCTVFCSLCCVHDMHQTDQLRQTCSTFSTCGQCSTCIHCRNCHVGSPHQLSSALYRRLTDP